MVTSELPVTRPPRPEDGNTWCAIARRGFAQWVPEPTVGPPKAYFRRLPALATGVPGTQRQFDGRMVGKASNCDRPHIRLEFQSEFPLAVARFFGWQRRPFH